MAIEGVTVHSGKDAERRLAAFNNRVRLTKCCGLNPESGSRTDLTYVICNHPADYYQWVVNTAFDEFDDFDTWCDLFEPDIDWDDYDSDEPITDSVTCIHGIDVRPDNNEYPVLVTYSNEFDETVLDWVSLKTLGLVKG